MRRRVPDLAEVRLVGPGEPLAHPEPALRTLTLVRDAHPDLRRTVLTNGVGLTNHIEGLDVDGVDLAMNTFDPARAARAYPWVRAGGQLLRGGAAGRHVVSQQIEAITALTDRGIDVCADAFLGPGIGLDDVVEFTMLAQALGISQVSWWERGPGASRTRVA